MAAIKLVFLGGGSVRAPGTVAAFVEHARHFDGSEIVLVDADLERLHLVRALGQQMIEYEGIDLRLSVTTDRRAALARADAVLAALHPGGLEAQHLDERLPLKHTVLGHATEGPGGFFAALRSLAILREVVAEMELLCPAAWLLNATGPAALVGEALAHHTALRVIGLCADPLAGPRAAVAACGLDPAQLEAVLVGLPDLGWTVQHAYAGQSVIPLLQAALESLPADAAVSPASRRLAALAAQHGALPAVALELFYHPAEVLAELQAAPQTPAEQRLAALPGYWEHFTEQAEFDRPVLDPARSPGGVARAAEVLAALVEDLDVVIPCEVPNAGRALPSFPPDRVVAVPCRLNADGATPLPQPPLPESVSDLMARLSAYQALASEAAWAGTRAEAVAALSAHPFVPDAETADALFTDLAAAQRAHLPAGLLP